MNPGLKKIISEFPGKEVLIWGDFILDEYVYTSTGRVSREAPVLVTEFEKRVILLGGAGNVLMNLLGVGADPFPVGLIGDDDAGHELRLLLEEKGVSVDGLITVPGFKTPQKSRILSGGENTRKQQILRIDALNRSVLPAATFSSLAMILRKKLEPGTSMIISDYLSQSVQSEIFQELRREFSHNLVCTDSRRHLLALTGTTIATPNEPELKNCFPHLGFMVEEDFYYAGRLLQEQLRSRGLILKRGHKGMIVFQQDLDPVKIDIYGTSEIVDVTGAGDTVLAVLNLALQAGASLLAAATLANIAGGIVVMKDGAYPIKYDELFDAVEKTAFPV